MSLLDHSHKQDLRKAGWISRGYRPHSDGRAIPQFITLRLFDSVPNQVLQRWKRELDCAKSIKDRVLMEKRIEKYIDQGYGEAFFRDHRVASMVQEKLLDYDREESTDCILGL